MKKKIMVVDSSGILHRARHNWVKEGTPMLDFFFKDLQHMVMDIMPNEIVLLNDISKSRYRQEVYPDYKSHRKESLKKMSKREQESMTIMRNIRNSLGVFDNIFPHANVNGLEADDVGTMLYYEFKEEYDVVLVTVDKDFFGDIPARNIYNHSKKRFCTDTDRNNLSMKDFRLYLTLKSDEADFPSLKVKGIGEKTALKLVNIYGNPLAMKNVPMSDIENMKDRFVKNALLEIKKEENWEKLKQIYELVKLFRDTTNLNDSEKKEYESVVSNIKLKLKETDKKIDITDEIDDLLLETQSFQSYKLIQDIKDYL